MACSSLVRQPYYAPKSLHLENQRIRNHTCDQERLLGWQSILYRRIHVDFAFLTVHKVCTKARLLGERSVRIREVKGSNPSRSIKNKTSCRVPAGRFAFYANLERIRTARPCRRQGNKSPGATTTTAACGRNRERLPPGSVQKGTAQLQGKCPSAASFLHLLMEFVGNTALSPSGQARMLHPHHSGFTRWKTSSACAQMQISSGPNVVSLVPATMPVSTAHATAFA